MSERPKIYLSGPMSGLMYEHADNWRQYASMVLDKLGLEPISPMRGKEMLRGKMLDEGVRPELVNGTAKAITFRDHWDTSTAKAMLVNLSDSDDAGMVSIGTMIEIGWAYAHRVPTVIVTGDSKLAEKIVKHPIVDGSAPWIVKELDDGLEIIRQLFNVPYTRADLLREQLYEDAM